MSSFTFCGVSSDDLGLIVTKKPVPHRKTSDYEILQISGKNEPIVKTKSTIAPFEMSIEADIAQPNKIREIYKHISGTGKLILSDENDKFYVATSMDLVPENVALYMHTIQISFTCLPFAYAIANDPVTYTTSPAAFKTIGTIYSEPVIKITGSGEITLTVNGVALRITDVVDNVTIDVPRRLAYTVDGSGNKTVCLDHTYGNLWDMLLVPDPDAFNRVSWTGDVTSVEITKNERWL